MHWKCSNPFATQNHWLKLIQQMLSWDYRWYMGHIQYPMIPLWPTCPDAECNPCKSFHSRSQFAPQTEWCMHYKDEVICFLDMREASMRIFLFTLKYKSLIFAQLDSTGKQKTVGCLFISLCFFFPFFAVIGGSEAAAE